MALTGKVGLITGGASGMGLACAERLVEQGWRVAILDINQEAGEAVQSKHGEKVLFVKSNVAIYEEQAAAFVQAWKHFGRLDFVYANAGIGDRIDWYKPAQENEDGSPVKPDIMVIDICFNAQLWSAYLALHYFRKNEDKKGKLVFTASQNGLYATGNIPLYTAAKHGIVGLARSMGRNCKKHEDTIQVNCVCPGLVPTNIMPTAISDATPKEHITPTSTVVSAIEKFLNDDSLSGEVAECSANNIYIVPAKEMSDEHTKYLYSGASVQAADKAALIQQLMEKKAALAKNLGEDVSQTNGAGPKYTLRGF